MLRRLFFLALCISIGIVPGLAHAISVKTYSYDKYGNLQEITDPRGLTTRYQYDLLNRLAEIQLCSMLF